MLRPSIFNDNLFDNFFEFPFFDDRAERKLYGSNANNLKEHKDGYELEIDLPGFQKDDLQAELKDGYLTISASKQVNKDEKEKETGKYIRRERYSGSCQRSFYVGDALTQEDIKAEFKHGILRLFVPKKEAVPEVEERKFVSITGE